jgi:hypothetical protein
MGLDCKPNHHVEHDPFYDPMFDLDRCKPIKKDSSTGENGSQKPLSKKVTNKCKEN